MGIIRLIIIMTGFSLIRRYMQREQMNIGYIAIEVALLTIVVLILQTLFFK